MPIAYVQSTSVDSGAVLSAALAFVSNNAAGNLLAVAMRVGSSTVTIVSVVDTNLNTYTAAREQLQTTDGHKAHIWSAPNSGAGANTVTVTLSGVATLRWAIHEYSGLDTVAPVDQLASAEADGTTAPSSGATPTTTVADELLFGTGTASGNPTWTAGASYTLREVPSGKIATEDRIVAATGTYTADFSLDVANNCTAAIVTFAAPSAATGQPTMRRWGGVPFLPAGLGRRGR